MNFSLNEAELDLVRNTLSLPGLKIETSPSWSSQEANHRELLHARRDELLSDSAAAVSISHTLGLGGLAMLAGDSGLHIGFDIELESRIRDVLVNRICKVANELEEAYSAASLWTAKEAAYKALKKLKQPTVISELQIGNWSMSDSQFEIFRLLNLKEFGAKAGRGCVLKKPPYSIAIYVCGG